MLIRPIEETTTRTLLLAATALLTAHRPRNGRRCVWQGNPIRVSPRIALALAMMLHELATNAIKYGALSTPHERVGVPWQIKEAEDQQAATGLRLLLRWEERDGPPVSPPNAEGVRLAHDRAQPCTGTRGEAHLRYEPEGVVCALDIPLEPC